MPSSLGHSNCLARGGQRQHEGMKADLLDVRSESTSALRGELGAITVRDSLWVRGQRLRNALTAVKWSKTEFVVERIVVQAKAGRVAALGGGFTYRRFHASLALP